MRIAYQNPGDTARALARAGKEQGGRCHARPYSYFEPDPSTWWAVPSASWPAPRLGKILVSQSGAWVPPGKIFVGFCVEKGLGAAPAIAGYCKPEVTLNATWLWHRFIGDLASGGFGDAVARSSRNLGEPLRLVILASLLVVARKVSRNRESVHFETGPESALRLVNHSRVNGVLDAASRVGELSQLAPALGRLPDADWTWIEICAGSFFDLPGADGAPLHAADLWPKLVEPFSPWLS